MRINLTKQIESKILKELQVVMLRAAKVIDKASRKKRGLKIEVKKGQGLVSTADLESERLIIKELMRINRDYSLEANFISEEDYFKKEGRSHKKRKGEEEQLYWIIDPLDGTNNFLNGLDYFAIAISLISSGKVVLGMVYRPRTDECFYASLQTHSYKASLLNIKRPKKLSLINHTERTSLKDCLFATGFALEKSSELSREFDFFKLMMKNSRAIRRMGSACLDLCYVAEGVFDGFWEQGLPPWDTSASTIILQRAGAMVLDYDGREYSPFSKSIIAARPVITKKLLKQVRSFYSDK